MLEQCRAHLDQLAQFLEEDLTEILDQECEDLPTTPHDKMKSILWAGTASDFESYEG